jgi:uncharacterized membrane protein YhaH (DUF805 family)
MPAFFIIAYIGIGFAQFFAVQDWFAVSWGWEGFFGAIAALFVTYIPILGSVLGVLGAHDVWHWSWISSLLLFFWYVPLALVVALSSKIKMISKIKMTSPFEDWFSLSIRRERKSFIFASLFLLCLLFIVFVFIELLGLSSKSKGIFYFVYFVMGLMCSYTLTAQRLRDINITGWLALLWVPISFADESIRATLTSAFTLALWVIPGTKGENKYGQSPIYTNEISS